MVYEVLLIDSHPIDRLGILEMIRGTELSILAEASNGEDGYALLQKQRFDLVLLDLNIGSDSLLSFLRKTYASHPNQPILIYTAMENDSLLAKCGALGVRGYVSKKAEPSIAIESFLLASRGSSVPPEAEGPNRGSTKTPEPREDSEVTPHEIELLRKVAQGLTNRQIAESMGVGYETLKGRLERLFQKIGANDRTQAAIWGHYQGLLDTLKLRGC